MDELTVEVVKAHAEKHGFEGFEVTRTASDVELSPGATIALTWRAYRGEANEDGERPQYGKRVDTNEDHHDRDFDRLLFHAFRTIEVVAGVPITPRGRACPT